MQSSSKISTMTLLVLGCLITTGSVQTTHAEVPPSCSGEIIDFEGLVHGAALNSINDYLNAYDLSLITTHGDAGPYNTYAIFDSDETQTADYDLEVDIGNLVIIQENNQDSNHDGIYDNPDDYAGGGKQVYNFDNLVDVEYFVWVDQDNGEILKITGWSEQDGSDGIGTKIFEIPNITPSIGNKDYELIELQNANNLKSLEFEYSSSGALSEICVNEVVLPPTNEPPTVSITSPTDGDSFEEPDTITFEATASDAEDGDISSSVSWESDQDGPLGTESSIATSLTAGIHIITATVSDSDGDSDSDEITITVSVPNSLPTVSITSPTDGDSFEEPDTITFEATASDAEDGDISSSVSWESDQDGPLGTESSIATSLTAGIHIITATVSDSDGDSDSDEITITVSVPNSLPTVSITSPTDGDSFEEPDTITFEATASDAEDGDISSSVSWESDQDGPLGTGSSIATSLTAGIHIITATVSDSDGDSDSDEITITVSVPNSLPTVSITSPTDGDSFEEPDTITFEATASDAEDGDISSSVSWESDQDGPLGTGSSIATSLTAGIHIITATVSDSDGDSDSDEITITVSVSLPEEDDEPEEILPQQIEEEKPNGSPLPEAPTIGRNEVGSKQMVNDGICIDTDCWTVSSYYHEDFELVQMLTGTHTVSLTIFCDRGVQSCSHVGLSTIPIGFFDVNKAIWKVEIDNNYGREDWKITKTDPQGMLGDVSYTVQIQDNRYLVVSFTIDFVKPTGDNVVLGVHIWDEIRSLRNFYFNDGIEIMDSYSYPTIQANYESSLSVPDVCLAEEKSNHRTTCMFVNNMLSEQAKAQEVLNQLTSGRLANNFESLMIQNNNQGFERTWDDIKQCYENANQDDRSSCSFADKILNEIIRIEQMIREDIISYNVSQNFD